MRIGQESVVRHPRRRRNVGRVLQNDALLPHPSKHGEWDVAELEAPDMLRGTQEGPLEKIDRNRIFASDLAKEAITRRASALSSSPPSWPAVRSSARRASRIP